MMRIDADLKQITFTDQRFYSVSESIFVPSVTTILSAYPKGPEFYNWLKSQGENSDDILKAAGERGTTVHTLTELYDSGEEVSLIDNLGRVKFSSVEWAMFERYVEFSERFNPTIHLIEENYHSVELGYAGTVDRVIGIKDMKILMDIKTSNAIYESYWLQLAAYHNLIDDASITHVGVMWLNSKTRTEGKKDQIQGLGWQLALKSVAEIESDKKLFHHTHQLWLAQNEGIKPRNITYKTKHQKP